MTESESASDDRGGSPGSRRRTDRLGELLPERTRDETATGWGDADESEPDDEHLRREVPPHHG